MTDTSKPKPAADPFFDLPSDSTWNACLGVQGHELNYVEGYLEAAIELTDAILARKLYDKRDTLVLPILYNVRHTVELTLKFVIKMLHGAGALPEGAPKDHDIQAHWKRLSECAVGDEDLRALIAKCEPFAASLARIDDDGQALRYAVRQDGQKSMADKSLANIAVIRKSLTKLEALLSDIKNRSIDYAAECKTGTFTKECSRKDLVVIARLLPQKSDWTKPEFDTAKTAIRERFGLSSKKFSKALDAIKACRETSAIIGIESPLAHLDDKEVVFAVEQWARRHPADKPRSELGTDYFDPKRFAAMEEDDRIAAEVNAALLAALSTEKIADLQTLFYMGRDRVPCEFYDRQLEGALKELRSADLTIAINHLMEKTNFKVSIAAVAAKLGRTRLLDSFRMRIEPPPGLNADG